MVSTSNVVLVQCMWDYDQVSIVMGGACLQEASISRGLAALKRVMKNFFFSTITDNAEDVDFILDFQIQAEGESLFNQIKHEHKVTNCDIPSESIEPQYLA